MKSRNQKIVKWGGGIASAVCLMMLLLMAHKLDSGNETSLIELSQQEPEERMNSAATETEESIETHDESMYLLRTDDGFLVFIGAYEENYDLCIELKKKAGNSLMDFYGWYKQENLSESVSTNLNEELAVTIVKSDTDWLSPHRLYAVYNADGDYPSKEDEYWTGGWHMYENNTSGDYSATARTVSVEAFADGNMQSLESGEGLYCDAITITWVNYLQASNTIKEDGTGREVVQEEITVTFDGSAVAKVSAVITALEDVEYQILYGLSMYCTGEIKNTNSLNYYVGSQSNTEGNDSYEASNSGDKNCTGVKMVGISDTIEMGIDTSVGLGDLTYDYREYSAMTAATGKCYMVLIYTGKEDMLYLSKNDSIAWSGYYSVYPTSE